MKKLLFILGTRPEAIKLQPVIKLASKLFDIKICIIKQHDNLIQYFSNYDTIELDFIRKEKNISGLVGKILQLLDESHDLQMYNPDLIIVHGDTCSALCGAMYAFYSKIKLCHIESGLRTHNKNLPFPEESNRKFIDYLSDLHFAPIDLNKNNLLLENISTSSIFVVGNSIIDVLKNKPDQQNCLKYGLVTLHRRENWDSNIEQSIKVLSQFALKFKYQIKFVMHPNTYLQNKIKTLNDNPFFEIYDPMSHEIFQNLLKEASFVVTDSGGIQEECVYFCKPLFIMRESTERPEIINNGCGYLVNAYNIEEYLTRFIENKLYFNCLSSLYGDGNTSKQIIQHIYEYLLQ